jgi:hypothetical protein
MLAGSGCESDTPRDAVYYWGAEVNVVCPCETEQCYWVRGSNDTLAALRRFVEQNTSEPYTGIHMRFHGRPLGPANSGFAAEYDGQIQVDRVLSLGTEIPTVCHER